eukprot:5933910-Amphidinium_carterae.1
MSKRINLTTSMMCIALQKGQRHPKGRPLTPETQPHWIKAHQAQQAVIDGRVAMEDFRGTQEA